MSKFACALNDQGRYAPTQVLEFTFLPDCNAHVWKGMIAETMADLADHINGALSYMEQFSNNPFMKLRVIEIGASAAVVDENESTPESVIKSLQQANDELNEVLKTVTPQSRATLKLIGADT